MNKSDSMESMGPSPALHIYTYLVIEKVPRCTHFHRAGLGHKKPQLILAVSVVLSYADGWHFRNGIQEIQEI